MQSTSTTIKNELSQWEIKALTLKAATLENKLSAIERRGAKIRRVDLVGISFFAAINSALIVMSILLIISLRTKAF